MTEAEILAACPRGRLFWGESLIRKDGRFYLAKFWVERGQQRAEVVEVNPHRDPPPLPPPNEVKW